MATKALNRVWALTTTTGTADVVISGPVTDAVNGDFFTPEEAGLTGTTNAVAYVLASGNNSEIGVGNYNATTDTLTRAATPTLSKINGVAGTTKISLAGTSKVMLTWIASDFGEPTLNLYGGTSTPAAPSAGLVLYSRNFAGRPVLSAKKSDGDSVAYAAHEGRNPMFVAVPTPNATTAQLWRFGAISGTMTARTPVSTNVFTSRARAGLLTTATAGTSNDLFFALPVFLRGNAAGMGGFHFYARFGLSHAAAVANGRAFVGLYTGTAAIGNVAVNSLLNMVGIGFESAATTWKIFSNDGTGVATQQADLGASFPTGLGAAGNQNWYELQLYCLPNDTKIGYRVERLDPASPAVGEGIITTDLPVATTMLTPHIWVNNGTSAVAAAIDWSIILVETDN